MEDIEELQYELHDSEPDEIELWFHLLKELLNTNLTKIGVSPLKTCYSSHFIVSYRKKKLKQTQDVLEQKHSHV